MAEQMSNRYLRRIYDEYNKKYFSGSLPRLPVRWGDSRTFSRREGKSTLAVTDYESGKPVGIRFAPRMRRYREHQLVRFTCLHEMVHVEQPSHLADHGRNFQERMRELANLKAFDGLW